MVIHCSLVIQMKLESGGNLNGSAEYLLRTRRVTYSVIRSVIGLINGLGVQER